MKQFAIIDFCGTVAKFQTLDPYLEFVMRIENPMRAYLLCNKFVKGICIISGKILEKVVRRRYLYKELLIHQMKGISEEKLCTYGEQYYWKKVRPKLIPQTLDVIQTLKDQGYETVVLSGGSYYYIKYFAEEYSIDHIITAQIEIVDGKCTGKLLHDCIGEDKLCCLYVYMKKKKMTGDYKVGLTDSKSDLPVLHLCERKIILSHLRHQEWITEEMEEIIWA